MKLTLYSKLSPAHVVVHCDIFVLFVNVELVQTEKSHCRKLTILEKVPSIFTH